MTPFLLIIVIVAVCTTLKKSHNPFVLCQIWGDKSFVTNFSQTYPECMATYSQVHTESTSAHRVASFPKGNGFFRSLYRPTIITLPMRPVDLSLLYSVYVHIGFSLALFNDAANSEASLKALFLKEDAHKYLYSWTDVQLGLPLYILS